MACDINDMMDGIKLYLNDEEKGFLQGKQASTEAFIGLLKLHSHWKTMSDWKIITDMRFVVAGCLCTSGLNSCCSEQLWVTYYMKAVHNKIWNPSTKLWE